MHFLWCAANALVKPLQLVEYCDIAEIRIVFLNLQINYKFNFFDKLTDIETINLK